MPRYWCDFCQTHLTHDSFKGRKQHSYGWKHRENVRLYFQALADKLQDDFFPPGMPFPPANKGGVKPMSTRRAVGAPLFGGGATGPPLAPVGGLRPPFLAGGPIPMQQPLQQQQNQQPLMMPPRGSLLAAPK